MLEFLQEWTTASYLLLWGAVILVFCVFEISTAAMVALWFIIGAFAAFFSVFAGIEIVWQFVIFGVVSGISFLFVRPLLVCTVVVEESPTNVNSLIGMHGFVLEKIDNLRGEGRVKVNGLDWAAKSETGEVLEKDAEVVVKAVEGVTLTVAKKI